MTSTSTRPLSEAARHVVVPSGIVKTGWPSVAAKLQQLGIGFDGWQQGATKLILGKRSDGHYAAGIGGVFMSLPRQVGKTYMVGALVFALCLLFPGMTVLWTAHRLKTAGETFRAMQGFANRVSIKPLIAAVRRGSGDWAIEFSNGSRILFGAREAGFGRGFAKVDVEVFDEAQILTDRALDDMLPAANASEHPAGALVLFMGTPPKPEDPSEVFSRARDEALSGESDDTLYIECSATPELDPAKWPPGYVDFEAVAEANPAFPLRTPRAAILRMAKRLSKESLRREGFGVWDAKVTTRATIPFGASSETPGTWSAGKVEAAPDGRPVYGVKFALDGLRVSLAVAVPDAESVHVEAIAQMSTADPRIGGLPLAEWLAGSWRNCSEIVIDGKDGAGALASELLRLKVPANRVRLMSTPDAITAHTQFLAAIQSGRLTHIDQAELNAAVKVATKRRIGTQGGWGWQAIGDGDVLDLDSATMAFAGAKNAKPRVACAPRRIY